ncbi:hypothetical protein BKA67DRAFT_658602 [Truncatella angustata]|uniref:MARVEL domain-containing protein n=1 Tax=Truncatella angustata TaxID=152316 RepID=A0A9P8UKP4_9PEZI|nr:uncharacterized protein BKA67DRAFT_658602 [Truncatella angustata]KAH6654295.1 hypothetical protein BKA67DRAFT_658602 [Truncatella angustata]
MANDGKAIIPTPTWVLIVRVFQVILSLIVIGGSGWFIHSLYLPSLAFAIVCTLFTWVIFVYAILSEKVSSCHGAYNTWAILSLDGLMIIFWLSAMGAVAAQRGEFKYSVQASCFSDGSTINSGSCVIYKRAYVANDTALAVMSAVAGVSALIMLLFVASFAYVCHHFRLSWVSSPSDAEKQAGGGAPGANNTTVQHQQPGVEMQANIPAQQAQPLLNQQQGGYPVQQQQGGYPQQQQQQPPKWAEAVYPEHTGYSHQGTPSPAPAPVYNQNQPYDPYVQQQSTGYAGAPGVYSPNQASPVHEVPYSPHTPGPHEAPAQHVQPVYQLPADHR